MPVTKGTTPLRFELGSLNVFYTSVFIECTFKWLHVVLLPHLIITTLYFNGLIKNLDNFTTKLCQLELDKSGYSYAMVYRMQEIDLIINIIYANMYCGICGFCKVLRSRVCVEIILI